MKFEYKIELLSEFNINNEIEYKNEVDFLNTINQDEWELLSVLNIKLWQFGDWRFYTKYYFKRPIIEK